MSEKYLAFVVVYNLLPQDFKRKGRIEEIESTINVALSLVDKRWEATNKNMLFSFPQDPSVTSAEIPVVVVIELLPPAHEFYTQKDGIIANIRNNNTRLNSPGKARGDLVVIVRKG